MATPRNGICSTTPSVLGTTVLLLTAVLAVRAADRTPAPVPKSTDDSSAAMTPQEAEKAIGRLQRALLACRDDSVAWQIRYHIGVIHFKAGMMAEAVGAFAPIAAAAHAPGILQACSLNMMGQIARRQGQTTAALETFGRLVALVDKLLAADPPDAFHSSLRRLREAALISRAEIYEVQRDSAAAAVEYEHFLQTEAVVANAQDSCADAPLVMDRLSQLHLQRRDVRRYLDLTDTLIARFPAYRRTPVVELENVCVRVLQEVQPEFEYPQGTLYVPVQVTAYLRHPRPAPPASEILARVDQVCRKYRDRPTSVLLDYWYAWMLEAAGRPDDACAAIARASASPPATEAGAPPAGPSPDDIRPYAAIQHAILLAEKGDYNQALVLLASLSPDPDQEPHVSRLVESTIKNVQTLKREVRTK
jgi:tetratricopeptide (TPR) repeat protein